MVGGVVGCVIQSSKHKDKILVELDVSKVWAQLEVDHVMKFKHSLSLGAENINYGMQGLFKNIKISNLHK